MASHLPIVLPYEVSTVFYPRLLKAPGWLLMLLALLSLPISLGAYLVLRPFAPSVDRIGAMYLGASALALVAFTLLYLPLATWLRVSESGITFSVAFWQRHLLWSQVREVRLIFIGGSSEATIEVITLPNTIEPRPKWPLWPRSAEPETLFIQARLFGWSAEALLDVMEDWRARHVEA